MSKKILLFSRDPGGCNVVAPLFDALKDKNYEVILYGKDTALSRYNYYGLSGKDILDRIKTVSLENIKEFLIEENPDFIITGTSADDFTEKYIWKSSEELGIPSFAILDQWINYGIRFSEFGVNQIKEYERNKEFKYLPTKILTMDSYSKSGIIAEGIDSDKILVSGHPYFDYIRYKKKKLESSDLFKKDKLNCKDGQLVVVFASEPITKTYNEGDSMKCYWGYNEKTIFKHFIEELSVFSDKFEKNVKLVLRLHPKDDENNYDEIISNVEARRLEVVLDRELDGLSLINSADLICGMSSMFLIESAMLGRPILSIQIGLSRENPFVLHKKGVIKSVLKRAELRSELKNLLLINRYKANELDIEEKSIEKVIKLMEEILCQS